MRLLFYFVSMVELQIHTKSNISAGSPNAAVGPAVGITVSFILVIAAVVTVIVIVAIVKRRGM